MNTSPYTFWLFDWGNSPGVRRGFYPLFIRVTIDSSALTLHLPGNPLTVPIQMIEHAERFSAYLYAGSIRSLYLRLTEEASQQDDRLWEKSLYVLPVDVFSRIPRDSFAEMDDIIMIIETYKQGKTPYIHPNPYQRELQRQNRLDKFSEEKWNASVPPNVYTDIYTLGKVMKLLLVWIPIMLVSFLLIVAIVYNVILPWFQGN